MGVLSKPTRKIPLGRPRFKWEKNIRMDLKEIDVNTRHWVNSVKDRDSWKSLVDADSNLRVL